MKILIIYSIFFTKNNECLVIDLTATGGIENKLFWYKVNSNDENIIIPEKKDYQNIEIKTENVPIKRTYLGYIKSFI